MAHTTDNTNAANLVFQNPQPCRTCGTCPTCGSRPAPYTTSPFQHPYGVDWTWYPGKVWCGSPNPNTTVAPGSAYDVVGGSGTQPVNGSSTAFTGGINPQDTVR